jgi:uncharacterized protein YecE (DUF72 family)
LEQYARFFRSVEVNSTFYQFPREAQLMNWSALTPNNFKFSIKVNRHITHTKRLRDVRRSLCDFLKTCSVLGDKLGPFLVGLSATFKKDLERFDDFVSLLPEQHRFAFEFRHSSWFDDEVFERFRDQRKLTLTMLGAQFASNVECFADFAYVRWHARGGELDSYSPPEIDYWARQICEISKKSDIFGYWNNDAHGYAPQNCLELMGRLPALCRQSHHEREQ